LNGIADDKLDNYPKCLKFLEERGKRFRETLKALGEDNEDEKDDDEPMS
jgi:hypothetical protein